MVKIDFILDPVGRRSSISSIVSLTLKDGDELMYSLACRAEKDVVILDLQGRIRMILSLNL